MKDIKDIGFGLIDRHTVIGMVFTMVLAQVLFGFQIPVDTTSASQLFIDIIILTGYLYLARSIYRLPVAAIASLTIIRTVLFRRTLELAKDGDKYGTWSDSKLKRFVVWIFLISASLIAGLIFFPLLISSFSTWAEEGKLPPSLKKFNKGFRRNILETLDRVGIVLIALLATIPSFHPYVKWLGVLGVSLMVIVFVLRGHFTALVRDIIEKEITEKEEKRQKDESKGIADNSVEEEKISQSSRASIRNGVQCESCGKFCTPNGKGYLPKYCSLKCRQKGYVLWNKDWCIGDGEARRLINILRDSGYSNWEENIQVIEKLGQVENLSAVWALLGIIHDDDHLGLDGNVKDAIKHIAKHIGECTLIPELNEAVVDQNDDVSRIAIEVLGEFTEKTMVFDVYLVKALQHKDVGVRRAAIQTLGEISDETAILALSNHLGKGEPAEDYLAINALVKMGDNAIPALKKALHHEYDWIGEEASKALKRIGTPEALAVLEEEENRTRIPCQNCKVPIMLTFPKGKKILKYGKSNWFTGLLRKWNKETTCFHCGTRMGVKLVDGTPSQTQPQEFFGVSFDDDNREAIRKRRSLTLDDSEKQEVIKEMEYLKTQEIYEKVKHLKPKKKQQDEDAI